MTLAEGASAAVHPVRQRIAILAVLFVLGFAALGVQTVSIALLAPYDAAQASARAAGDKIVRRGDIVDRNGAMLATTLVTYTLFANPKEVWDAEETAWAIRRVFPEMDHEDLVARLSERDRSYVELRTNLTPRERQAVFELGQPGVGFAPRERRVYPHGGLGAHVLGFTNRDNEALGGVELALDGAIRKAADGEPLRLSLDLRVQHAVEAELAAVAAAQSARGGVGAVMDVRTGEYLALASWPTFDPNRAGRAPADAKVNRATLSLYEMGSTFKAFTIAMGLEAGVVTPESGYDASRPIRVQGARIADFHAQNRYLTIPEILSHSSNIGTTRLALDVGPARHQAFLKKLGLLDRAPLEVAEVGRPLTPRQWTPLTTATLSYGYGASVTPNALMAAFGAIVNGGWYVQPTLLARPADTPVERRQVVSPKTSAEMVTLLRAVVTDGTGGKAEADGYQVAGKTGTAEKQGPDGRYDTNRRVSSFLGVFPAHDPRYAVLVLLDEPQGSAETHGVATAGWTAAPAVSRIVARAAPLLDVVPVRALAQADAATPGVTP